MTRIDQALEGDVSVNTEHRPGGGFPTHFVWGAAAAAYQIEGAADADGKGPSIWDSFCRRPGGVFSGHTGDVACDHYNRFAEDVRLMSEIGIDAYRLSVSWPRVLPDGFGRIEPRGLDFYSRLVDTLLAAGITPWVTLFHWDLPEALQDRGGWLNPDSQRWFADYAAIVGRVLSDRVAHFITLNEPQIYLGLGYFQGIHAPGLKLSLAEVLRAGHNTLLAHGRAVQALRASAQKPILVGAAPVALTKYPATDSAADLEAARRATHGVFAKDPFNNSWWMDPLFLGKYPEDGLELFGKDAPRATADEMRVIATPTDFLGINVYQGTPVVADDSAQGYREVPHPPGFPHTAFDWPITPQALRFAPRFLHERYQVPIFITENGLSCRDAVAFDGEVHDSQRIEFTREYLCELERSIADGTDVRGYFHWSILDNFEWAAGYRERFGLIHVDFQTQVRTLKRSAHFYHEVCTTNGRSLHATSSRPPVSHVAPALEVDQLGGDDGKALAVGLFGQSEANTR